MMPAVKLYNKKENQLYSAAVDKETIPTLFFKISIKPIILHLDYVHARLNVAAFIHLIRNIHVN